MSPSAPTIDLRSDTVTQPSPAMRRAMADAEVGDDVLDGDPTTRRLEERIAQLLGTEDALFFPSGTQANQTGIALVTEPGTEHLLEANAHLVHSEVAGVAALSGVQNRPITTGLYALDHNLARIGEDHENARRFAELLSGSPAVRPSDPQTNIVMVDLRRERDTPESVSQRLAQAGVRLAPWGPRRLRAVTHLDVSRADAERAARIVLETLA